MSAPVSERRVIAPRRSPQAQIPWPVQRLHLFFDGIGDLGLAALLRELGRALYNRDIMAWKVLVDISDELLERETRPATHRLMERWLRKPPALIDARRASRRSRRKT